MLFGKRLTVEVAPDLPAQRMPYHGQVQAAAEARVSDPAVPAPSLAPVRRVTEDYELYAVVVHEGNSPHHGHYYTYARPSDCLDGHWRQAVDASAPGVAKPQPGAAPRTGSDGDGDSDGDDVSMPPCSSYALGFTAKAGLWHRLDDSTVTPATEFDAMSRHRTTGEVLTGDRATPYMLWYRRVRQSGGAATEEEEEAKTAQAAVVPDVAPVLAELVAADNAIYLQSIEDGVKVPASVVRGGVGVGVLCAVPSSLWSVWSVWLSGLSVCLCVWLSGCLVVCVSVCLYVRLCVCLWNSLTGPFCRTHPQQSAAATGSGDDDDDFGRPPRDYYGADTAQKGGMGGMGLMGHGMGHGMGGFGGFGGGGGPIC